MTWTPTVLTMKDAAGASQNIIAYTDGTNFSFAHPLLDSTGTIISPATQGTLASLLSSSTAIQAAVTAATPAGSNIIGRVTTDQTTHGTTDLVAADITKVAGGAIAQGAGTAATALRVELPTDGTGKVGLNAGTAVVGKFTTDQTTHGTTDLVAADITKVAGSPISQGHGTAATAIRVELPTDGTGVVGLIAGSNVIGGVTIADGSSSSLGAKADSAASTDTGTFSLIALFKRLLQSTTTLVAACQAATPAGTNLIGKVGIDQTTPGTTNLVYLPDPRIVTGNTTTRPANTTAYIAGQLLANSTTAGSVTYPTIAVARANDAAGVMLRLRLKKSGTTLTNGIFRVHFYNAQPTVTNGDGGTWLTTTSGYVGSFDVTMTQAFSDSAMGIGSASAGMGIFFTPATGTQNLYYLIETRAAYTPISGEVFTPYVEVQ